MILFLIGHSFYLFQISGQKISCTLDHNGSAAVKSYSAMLKDEQLEQETFDGWNTTNLLIICLMYEQSLFMCGCELYLVTAMAVADPQFTEKASANKVLYNNASQQLGVFCKSRWNLSSFLIALNAEISWLYHPIISNGMSNFVLDQKIWCLEIGDIGL